MTEINSATYHDRQIAWEIVDECIVIHDYQAGEAVNTVIPIGALAGTRDDGFRMAGRVWKQYALGIWQADDGAIFKGEIPCDHEGSWNADPWPWNPGVRKPYCTRCGHSYPPKPA